MRCSSARGAPPREHDTSNAGDDGNNDAFGEYLAHDLPRPAPNAARMANSPRRPSPRINSRLATFALAMSNTNPTAANNAISVIRTSPMITSAKERTTGMRPRCAFAGASASSCAFNAAISLAACSLVTPGRSRPIRFTSRRAAFPNGPSVGTDFVVLQISTPVG